MKQLEAYINVQFPGGYGRIGAIVIKTDDCRVCRREQILCLVIDASEGEYRPGAICKDCVEELFHRSREQP